MVVETTVRSVLSSLLSNAPARVLDKTLCVPDGRVGVADLIGSLIVAFSALQSDETGVGDGGDTQHNNINILIDASTLCSSGGGGGGASVDSEKPETSGGIGDQDRRVDAIPSAPCNEAIDDDNADEDADEDAFFDAMGDVPPTHEATGQKVISRLPVDVLARILSHIPRSCDRLRLAAVSRSFASAACEAGAWPSVDESLAPEDTRHVFFSDGGDGFVRDQSRPPTVLGRPVRLTHACRVTVDGTGDRTDGFGGGGGAAETRPGGGAGRSELHARSFFSLLTMLVHAKQEDLGGGEGPSRSRQLHRRIAGRRAMLELSFRRAGPAVTLASIAPAVAALGCGVRSVRFCAGTDALHHWNLIPFLERLEEIDLEISNGIGGARGGEANNATAAALALGSITSACPAITCVSLHIRAAAEGARADRATDAAFLGLCESRRGSLRTLRIGCPISLAAASGAAALCGDALEHFAVNLDAQADRDADALAIAFALRCPHLRSFECPIAIGSAAAGSLLSACPAMTTLATVLFGGSFAASISAELSGRPRSAVRHLRVFVPQQASIGPSDLETLTWHFPGLVDLEFHSSPSMAGRPPDSAWLPAIARLGSLRRLVLPEYLGARGLNLRALPAGLEVIELTVPNSESLMTIARGLRGSLSPQRLVADGAQSIGHNTSGRIDIILKANHELSGLAVVYLASHTEVRSVVLKRCSQAMSIVDRMLVGTEFAGSGVIQTTAD